MRLVGLTAIGLGLAVAPLHGQAVTGAAIWGSISAPGSAPIAAAVVLITNTSNGERWQTVSFASGRYYLDNVSVGGPYRIDVRAIGYVPAHRDSVVLSLGQRFTADFTLQTAAIELEAITVTAGVDPLINAGRTGPAQTLAGSTIARLPVRGRDFSQLALLSPQVVESPGGGLSIAGQPDRLNSYQVDGATNNDLFGGQGFSPGIGTVGSIGGAHSLSVEAVRELQVVTAPFDVRYGNFAAGLINAVTRSGSNRLEGSVVGYLQNEALSGKDTTGSRGEEFTNEEIGVAVSGPLVQNRLAWFVNADLRRSLIPDVGPVIGTDTTGGADSVGTGFRYASVKRFQDILRNTYGVEPGTFTRLPFDNPARNVFAKLTWQPRLNQRLDVSYNYVYASYGAGGGDVRPYDRVLLSSRGVRGPSSTNAARATWTAAFGNVFSNELTAAYLRERDTCQPSSRFPIVEALIDVGLISAGRTCNTVGPRTVGDPYQIQDLAEVTDNLTWSVGTHQVTIGTHDEFIHLPGSRGFDHAFEWRWRFNSLDSLERGLPFGYTATVRGAAGTGPLSDLRVNQLGFYVQDRWTPTARLTLTAGLRFDVPFLPTPPRTNPTLLADLGINTSTTPSGNLLWSPRVGFNYDFTGRGDGSLRGGIGLFAGRPAYKWFNGVYVYTGLEEARLDCSGAAVPVFTIDLDNQPTTCGAGAVQPTAKVMAFDPAFRFPRNLKIALGVDRRLPAGVVGTVDVLYTRGVDQFYLRELNLAPALGVASGEGGRVLYGTTDPLTGEPSPARRSQNFGSVLEVTNAGGDRALSLTAQLQRRFPRGIELNAAYTYTDTRDRLSATEEYLVWDLGYNPIDGTLDDRRLTTSLWSVPHKVTIFGAVDLPFKFRLSFVYTGRSGAPFTYVVAGDANADGLDYHPWIQRAYEGGLPNDVVYVPRNASDITLAKPGDYAALDQFIQGEPCLREQRGRLMGRNSCRNPWINITTARVSKVLPIAHGQSVEVTADLFNVLNLLNGEWGLVRQMTDCCGDFENAHVMRLLELVGYDPTRGRGVYNVLPVNRKQIVIDASRWRLQLGARYTF